MVVDCAGVDAGGGSTVVKVCLLGPSSSVKFV